MTTMTVTRVNDNGTEAGRPDVVRMPEAPSRRPVGWLALRNLAEALELASLLFKSNCFQGVSREQMLVRMIAGAEMGIGPLASVSGIRMIKGNPTLGAHLMASAIKRSGRYDYEVIHLDRERAEVA